MTTCVGTGAFGFPVVVVDDEVVATGTVQAVAAAQPVAPVAAAQPVSEQPTDEQLATVPAPARQRRIAFGRSRALRWSAFAALIGVEVLLVLPHLSFSAAAFGDVDWTLLLAAVVAEAVSIGTFSRMRRGLLRAGGVEVPLRQMGVLTLASNAISATAPAGTAVSTAYLYQQLRRKGADTGVVLWVLIAGSVMSGMAFSVLTVAGAMLDGDLSVGELVSAAGVSVLLGVGLVAALAFVSSHPAPLLRAAEAVGRRLPKRWRKDDENVLHERTEALLVQLATISVRRRDWGAAFVLSVLNWGADLACFVLCCYAVGARGFALGGAVLAYVAGLATISLTITPGGLGSVEAGMLIGLANAGVAAPLALAGVLAYRLVAYVLVGAVGWFAWLGIRRGFRPEQAGTDAVRAAIAAAAD